MQLTDLLKQTGGTAAIARELGLSEGQATSGAAALLPSILAGLQKPAAAAQPAGGLGGLLGALGGGALLEQVLAPQATNTAPGNDLLGHIFGNKEGSRAVAQNAAGATGLDPSILKKMLPLLAMLVAGYLAKQNTGGAQGGLGGVLGNLGGALGGGNAAGGNPLNDLLGRLGR